jgi:hypothetical protein
MLFNGWSVTQGEPQWGAGKNNPWKGHPFNKNNNVNGINGDTNGDNQGFESDDLSIPAVTVIQEAYVQKVIDTVNDLDNVLYEICNEGGTKDWQYHMINFIHTYEKDKPKQHPVGMTHMGDDAALRASPADWISIMNGASLIPPVADGSKVSLLDTDHLCGVCGDRVWVWEAFTRGHNPIFMDAYDGTGYGVGGAGFVFNDPRWVSARANMGYALTYANRINLAAMTPQPELCSTGYCLANAVASGAEYLAYLPSGGSMTMDISAAQGTLTVEWFDPENGTVAENGTVEGGSTRTITAPFSGDTVLYIYDTDSSQSTPMATKTSSVPPITPTDIQPTPTSPSTDTAVPCATGMILFILVLFALNRVHGLHS